MLYNLFVSVVLGIVQGITEWLPVSSTGHMILLNEFLKMNVSEDFFNLFLVVIQFGSILAVVVLYFNRIWPLKKNTGKSTNGKTLGSPPPEPPPFPARQSPRPLWHDGKIEYMDSAR